MGKHFSIDFVTGLADDKNIRLPHGKVEAFLECLEVGERAYFNIIAKEDKRHCNIGAS